MDDQSIAPVEDSADATIAAYRKYLEQNTGYRAGAGPSVGAPQGASIAPVEAQPQDQPIAPVAGPYAGGPGFGPPPSATPTLDAAMPSPLQTDAPDAPQADQAPQAPRAKKADKAKGAKQATQAPMIAPVPGANQPPDESQPLGSPANPRLQPTMIAAGSSSQGSQITSDPSQMTPASAHVAPGQTTADGRPMIQIKPPDHQSSDFDTDKLQDAHNIGDVFNALPAKKQSSYMDWWEQQHGDINARYDSMLQDLGQRPDPDRDPTRKEKFVELMNFGLNLMRNARRGTDQVAGAAEAAQDALATQQARQRQQTSDYDARANAINAQRQNQLKDLGTLGEASREDALIQNAQTRTNIAALNAQKQPKATQPTTRVLKNGQQVEWDETSKSWKLSVGPDGKPLGPVNAQGPRGGTGSQSKQLELIQALEGRGYSTADAVNSVLHIKPSGDPFHDYVAVLNKNTPQGATPEEKADAASMAQETVDHLYGPGALDAARAKRNQAINGPGATPPLSTLQQGKVTRYANGQRWTLGPNGQPQQVQ